MKENMQKPMKFRVVYKTFQLAVAVMPEDEFRVLRKCKMLAHILKNGAQKDGHKIKENIL